MNEDRVYFEMVGASKGMHGIRVCMVYIVNIHFGLFAWSV
jgi:hypothetical protein